MIGRNIKIPKEDRKRIVEYLETNSAEIIEEFLKNIKLPKQMHQIIVLRYLKRNKIKDISK